MYREGMFHAVVSVVLLGCVIVAGIALTISHRRVIGPMMILLGMLPWIPLKIAGRSIQSTGADIIFGGIDTGVLALAALIGASFAGVLGAIVGGAVGDSITDALAGLFEGRMAESLRRHNIQEARTPLSSSMGKMSGCLIDAGLTLSIAWSLFGISI